ncbi:signal transduction protein [Catenovulum agarivorans DS-2]|uniref:Signal transduction protein n=2 Tax=Catenovulum agarivorans TaxID=1172192 RepID=W7R271_9ALTE|nr:signal transduction protein [Catenovulum agarivorans DS-2]
MSGKVVSVEMDDSLAEVKRIFDNAEFHHLVVLSDYKLVGVISDRDLLKALSPNLDSAGVTARELACLNKKAHQIMSRNPITLLPTATIKQAVRIFNQHKISCIPIVDPDNKVQGIVTWRDVMRKLEEAYQKT